MERAYTLEGGRLLAQGTYGCVFDPPLRCNGKKIAHPYTKGTLGKITEPVDFLAEKEAAEILGTLPVAKKYYILPDLSSICYPTKKQTEPQLSLCKPIKVKPLESFVQFEMPYGGNTLYQRMSDSSFKTPAAFFQLVQELLEAGAYMAAKSFVHYDIQNTNLVLDENNHIRLIDFGQSFHINTFTKENLAMKIKVYIPEYNGEAPESTVISGILDGVPAKVAIRDLIKGKSSLQLADSLLGLRAKDQERDLREFWKTSHSVRNKDFVEFFKLYWPGFDAFMIGTNIIMCMYRFMMIPSFTESKEWREKSGRIYELLRGLLQASPRKRIDAIEALYIYDPTNAWFSEYGVSWMTKKAAQRRV